MADSAINSIKNIASKSSVFSILSYIRFNN